MRLLLDDQYAPITSSIGFIESNMSEILDKYANWMDSILKDINQQTMLNTYEGRLNNALNFLIPLTAPIKTKVMFLTTDSDWIAYFDNGRLGTDPIGILKVLSRKLQCRAVSISAVYDSMKKKKLKNSEKKYGIASFEILKDGDVVRNVYSANDGGRWTFSSSGNPLSFENISQYNAKIIKNKFTIEQLQNYMQHIGIDVFNDNFYLPMPKSQFVVLERKGIFNTAIQEFSLEEALTFNSPKTVLSPL